MSGQEQRPDIASVLAGLKDFQRLTVDYAFRRLYTDPDATRRFLVADEVGLGKTLVARGLIARAVDHLWSDVSRIDVLYICSNLDIARQNINRLRLPGREDVALASRITLLPTLIHDMSLRKLNFISFTPGTSLDPKSSMGTAEERALLYVLLERAWGVRGKGPLNVLQGLVRHRDDFEWRVSEMRDRDPPIDEALSAAFAQAVDVHDAHADLDGSLHARFDDLCARFRRTRRYERIPYDDQDDRRRLIADLRHLLATTCITALQPDLVILDEFQRFRNLLHGDDAASELAKDLFTWQSHETGESARVLLLSATPYKMYTVAGEVEDDHYRDFLATMRFLYDDDQATDALADDLQRYKNELFTLTKNRGPRITELREQLERRLGRVMCRTERLAASADRNGMLTELPPQGSRLEAGDVKGYLAVQRIARELGLPDTIEYWKSAPYLLNFMDNYQLKQRAIEDLSERGVTARVLVKAGDAIDETLLPWDTVDAYGQIAANNPRVRSLMADVVDSGAWKMLWLHPSLPYYAAAGPFADVDIASGTKRLVFSAWQVVPKAVAAMLTYAAERNMMRALESDPQNTPDARAARARLLSFRVDERERPASMANLTVLYPSVALAAAADPLAYAAEHGGELPATETLAWAERRVEALLSALPSTDVITHATLDALDPTSHPFAWEGDQPRELIPDFILHLAYHGHFQKLSGLSSQELLARGMERWQLELLAQMARRADKLSVGGLLDHCERASRESAARTAPETGAVDERWYWAGPLLLDLARSVESTRRWWLQADLAELWTGEEPDEDAGSRWHDHVDLARAAIFGDVALGRRPDDLAHVLALLSLGAPGIVALRAITRAVGTGVQLTDFAARNAAARTAWGFRALFNVPEVTALVRSFDRDERYWQRVASYCFEGSLQAVLDEYTHVLVEYLGLQSTPAPDAAEALGAEMENALSVRPARLGVDAFELTTSGGVTSRQRGMRARFAARFGDEASDDGGAVSRAGQVRSAFNSPFWPFVLTTTSVGQEGLDFHLYCHAVVHWNLPSNPVDLEQREGRVHRYKGHAVRRNLATRHGRMALTADDPWRALFELGALDRREGETELVPYWLYTVPNGVQVERHVMMLPLSRESGRLESLRRSLTIYRMAFGQSRQDDLIEYLRQRLSPSEAEAVQEAVRLDLSPSTLAAVSESPAR